MQEGGYPPNNQGAPPKFYAPPNANGGGGPIHRDSNMHVTMIQALNPYSSRWSLCARVLSKTKRTYKNAKGDGKLMNLDLTDATGTIRATAFNEQMDAFWDRVQVGDVYLISGGQLKQANPAFNKTGHVYEIAFSRASTIEPCTDPELAANVPKASYSFVPIASLESSPEDSYVDVLAIISTCDEPLMYTNKKGNEVTKRVLTLADSSGRSIEATIFGENASDPRLAPEATIAIRGAKVGNWNTKSLTLWSDCYYDVHPDMAEAHQLAGWWRQAGGAPQVVSISTAGGGGGREGPRICFEDIEERAMGMNGQAEYFSVACWITHCRIADRTLWYIACPTCKKKVPGASEENLSGHCEKCGTEVYGTRRWIFSAQCNDATGARYVHFFDDTACLLLEGATADSLAPQRDTTAFDQHFQSICFKRYLMSCAIKADVYNDEQRLKVSCTSLKPLSAVDEGQTLLQEIRQLSL